MHLDNNISSLNAVINSSVKNKFKKILKIWLNRLGLKNNNKKNNLPGFNSKKGSLYKSQCTHSEGMGALF